jgi:electron transfer flavoprotein alpha subunit
MTEQQETTTSPPASLEEVAEVGHPATPQKPLQGEVFVLAEQLLGDLQPVTLELLGAGRDLATKLGAKLTCMVVGHQLGEIPKKLVAYGADRVYVADHPSLKYYNTLAYKKVVCDLMESLPVPPHIMLIGSTTTGRDIAPRIAAHFLTGLTADVIELDIGPYEHTNAADPDKVGLFENCLYAVRPSFGESLKARILGPWKNPQMATTRPGVMVPLEPDWNRAAEVVAVPVTLTETDLRMQIEEMFREVQQGADLSEADVIVAGGFGLGSVDAFQSLEELAACFQNGIVGATRKVVDLGWYPYKRQIGQTGKTVRPKLYIACGISGAIQHRVGMSSSKTIIAINKDPDAPIFKFAHYGIVGDVTQVVQEMVRQLKAGQSPLAAAAPVATAATH